MRISDWSSDVCSSDLLGEETSVRPKPMVEIGGMPIIWHIMKIYSAAGVNDFIVCLGYKGYMIKEYFANYFLHTADVTIDLKNNSVEVHQNWSEPWRITLVDRSEEHTSELQSLMRISYAVFCLKKKKSTQINTT